MRSLNASLNIHWFAATLVWLALIPVIGAEYVWTADEGAQLAQSHRVARNEWFFDHPVPLADPTGQWFPFHLSGQTEDGFFVLGKHRLFTLAVAGLMQSGGLAAVMAASVLGTTAAARGAAEVVRRVVQQPVVPVVVLWLTVAASPLGFASFLGYAHTLAATCATLGFLGGLFWVNASRFRFVWFGVGAAAVMLGPMVRSESTLVGVALGLGWIATSKSWPTGNGRSRAVSFGLVALVAVAVGFIVDSFTAISSDTIIQADPDPYGLLPGRWAGLQATWLWTSQGGWGPLDFFLIAAPLLWGASGLLRDRRPDLARIGVIVGAAMILVAVGLNPERIVPGMLVAFPLFVLAVAWMRAPQFGHPVVATATATFVLYCAAVLATQHSIGGTSEWGGRYFAAGMPLAMIMIAPGLEQLVAVRRLIAPVAASVVLLGSGLVGLEADKNRTASVASAVAEGQSRCSTDRPVTVSTLRPVSRWLWESAGDDPWLLVPEDELGLALERLAATGTTSVVVVAEAPSTSPASATYDFVDTQAEEEWVFVEVWAHCDNQQP